MPVSISIEPNDLKWLQDLPGNFKKDMYTGIRKAMLFAESEAKQSFGKAGNLNVRTGNLRRSIKGTSKKEKGRLVSTTVYSAIHELGGVIRPKRAKRLKFKVGGSWKSAAKVIMPARPFLRPAFENNMDEISEIILDSILKGMKEDE